MPKITFDKDTRAKLVGGLSDYLRTELDLEVKGFDAEFLLDFVTRHGFAPFAWWRIAVGVLGLAGLALTGTL